MRIAWKVQELCIYFRPRIALFCAFINISYDVIRSTFIPIFSSFIALASIIQGFLKVNETENISRRNYFIAPKSSTLFFAGNVNLVNFFFLFKNPNDLRLYLTNIRGKASVPCSDRRFLFDIFFSILTGLQMNKIKF